MIKYYNRKQNKYEIEKVAGEKYLNWSYSSSSGKGLVELLLKKKLFSKLYGYFCDTKISSKKLKILLKNLIWICLHMLGVLMNTHLLMSFL